MEKLGFITKHELYSRAAQKPQPIFPSPEQMLFDHEFTKLVKELEGQSGARRRTHDHVIGGKVRFSCCFYWYRHDHQSCSQIQ